MVGETKRDEIASEIGCSISNLICKLKMEYDLDTDESISEIRRFLNYFDY